MQRTHRVHLPAAAAHQGRYDLTRPHLELEFSLQLPSTLSPPLHNSSQAAPSDAHLHKRTPGLFPGKGSYPSWSVSTPSPFNTRTALRCVLSGAVSVSACHHEDMGCGGLTLSLSPAVFIGHFAQCCLFRHIAFSPDHFILPNWLSIKIDFSIFYDVRSGILGKYPILILQVVYIRRRKRKVYISG